MAYEQKPGSTTDLANGGQYDDPNTTSAVTYGNLAADSAASAANSATAAAGSAISASNFASSASTSASNALTSENNAAASAVAAADSAIDAADASRLTAGTTTTLEPNLPANVTITGPAGSQLLNLSIPRGQDGSNGAPNVLNIGTVVGGDTAAATITGTSPAQTLNLVLPKGDAGDSATVAVGTTTTLSPGSSASVTNSGTSSAAVFNFSIPRGDVGATGPKGDTGDTGATGAAATINVGSTTTGAAGSSASVTNSGTSSAAVFNFQIPRGDTGATGPKGDTGDTGAQGIPGINWLGTWSSSTTYAVRDAITYNGTSYYAIAANTNQVPPNASFWDVLAQKGTDGTGAGDMLKSENLSGLTNYVTARSNLGLGTAATTDSTAYATAAQGALADTAIQTLTSVDGSVALTTTGTTRDLSVATTKTVIAQVRNTTGATLTKGTAVYISGATGQISTVSKALASGDSTSAQTLGIISADLPNNTNGSVTIIGLVTNIDTSAYTDGQQLYLSPTVAGTLTATKPYAPGHIVYMAVVEYAHATQGKLFVKVQNGYELDELHDVDAQSPTNGQTLVFNSSTNLWEKNTVSLTAGVNGTLPLVNGGTNSTTAQGAINTLAGAVTDGAYLRGNGTNVVMSAIQASDVPTLNQNTTGTAANITASSNSTLTTLSSLSLPGSQVSGDISGNAANVTGTVAVANGGTGLSSLTANNVILGNGTSTPLFVAPGTSGNVLSSNGTSWVSTTPTAGGLSYIFTTVAVTLADKQGALTDTTVGPFTVTLPATPSVGTQVVIADSAGTWGTNNLTIGRNGSTISGSATDLVCDIPSVSVHLVYNGTTWDVYAQIGGNGGTAVTLNNAQTLTNKTISAANNTLVGVASTGKAIAMAIVFGG